MALLATPSPAPRRRPVGYRSTILTDLAMTFGTKALSIQQPWNWAIHYLFKPVENRSWTTDYRGPLLTHAGKTIDPAGYDVIAELTGRKVPKDLILGALTGWVRLVGIHHANDCAVTAGPGEPVSYCSPWAAAGQYHWEIDRPHVFVHPFPIRGQRRLWVPVPGWMRRTA